MKKIVTETFIPATPNDIWDVLTDAASHAEWNSQIVHIKGKLEPGERPRVRVHAPIGNGLEFGFKGKIVGFETGKRLAWEGGIPGILNGQHYWHLEPFRNGTRVVHGETFAGLFAPLLTKSLLNIMKPSYEESNEGLKKYMMK